MNGQQAVAKLVNGARNGEGKKTPRFPRDWGRQREEVVEYLVAAYSTILEGKMQNWGLWKEARQMVSDAINENCKRSGLHAPPFGRDVLEARLTPPYPMKDANDHIRYVEAFMTDYTDRIYAHIRYREKYNGNVHFEFTGPTGLAKSSCAIRLADDVRPIDPENLPEHLSYDAGELPRKLVTKSKGETVIQDEFFDGGGEGSSTVRKMVNHLEDQLRASGVNLFMLSPRKQDHNTMQIVLEAVLWNPEEMWTAFMGWVEGYPMGLVAIDWAPKDLWEVYTPWKEANLKRTLAAQFRDNVYLVRLAMKLFDDERFIEFMCNHANKPKKSDFEAGVEFFQPQMIAASQAKKMAGLMFEWAQNFDRLKDRFEELFGVKPSEGLKKISDKLYKE